MVNSLDVSAWFLEDWMWIENRGLESMPRGKTGIDPRFTNLVIQSPGRYQRLDLFNKVLSVLCPNLTDASIRGFHGIESSVGPRGLVSFIYCSFDLGVLPTR